MNNFLKEDFINAIGNTPLIKLRKASAMTGCNIYGKAEFMNPGGSVKDRAAKAIIEDALKHGKIKKGGTVVEGTAGNTGIGLALVGNSLGIKTIIVIPDSQSQEKKDFLRLIGAEVVEVPPTKYSDPKHYIHTSRRMAEDLADMGGAPVLWANQFDNVANRQGHYETTGAEIWEQTDGKIDGFICAVGTGGTLSGIAQKLREKNKNIKIGLADPMGASLYNYYTTGELTSTGSSITEGIGQGRITENLAGLKIDHPFQITDQEALPYIFDLLQDEGLCLGGSSAVNIAGAVKLAKTLGTGKTIVTILCDSGARYQSKLFNPAFLREKNLPLPSWLG
ncbi:MAG: cysteine synthase A [Hydrotalea sp.]|nr:cysteine synthase A [Hydrotalea sp.]